MTIHRNNRKDTANSSPDTRKRSGKTNDSAVSPVVGVMLMLIVVIIIAAVVSGFAGSLMNGKQKVPTLAMDFDIANSGHWSNSYFKGEVTSTSAPINTHDLKIVTSWTKNFINGTVYRGGATTSPGVVNTNIIYDTHGGAGYDLWRLTVPYGYGAGVGNGTPLGGNIFWTIDSGGGEYAVIAGASGNSSWWGNYKLQAGTRFLCRPFGGRVSSQAYGGTAGINQFVTGYGVTNRFQYNYSSTPYVPDGKLTMEGYASTTTSDTNGWLFPYPADATGKPIPDPMSTTYIPYVASLPSGWDPRQYSIDQMQGVLGNNWEVLRPGDVVNVKIIFMPTGSTMWQKDVVVSGTTQ